MQALRNAGLFSMLDLEKMQNCSTLETGRNIKLWRGVSRQLHSPFFFLGAATDSLQFPETHNLFTCYPDATLYV